MSKIKDVFRFELRRAAKKKTFWYATFSPVIIIALVLGIEKASIQKSTNAAQQQVLAFQNSAKIALLDQSGIIDRRLLPSGRVTFEPTKDSGIQDVKAGRVDAFFFFPADVATHGIEVYGQDKGISYTPPYDQVAIQLLHQSAVVEATNSTRNAPSIQILEHDPATNIRVYKQGMLSNSQATLIAPGVFAVAFLVLLVLLSYQMIAATTEEKENRSAEMLLTSISARSLIIGKIATIFALGAIQLTIILVPLVIYFLKTNATLLGNVTITQIPLDPPAIIMAAALALGGFVLYTAIIIGMGAMFPSANEAARFMGVILIGALLPIYIISEIITTPHAFIVAVFTYFPLTAPTTALARNAVGSLPWTEAWPALVVIYASAALAILFAMRAFRYGAMEYGRRISLRELLSSR
jgi:ABC-2 type transport system permease protein